MLGADAATVNPYGGTDAVEPFLEYEDKGVILEMEPQRLLKYSHFGPPSGEPDVPENYHTVTIELSREGEQTVVLLSQDNNDTEEARLHSEENWQSMLEGLKDVVENM